MIEVDQSFLQNNNTDTGAIFSEDWTFDKPTDPYVYPIYDWGK
jgi:hypothetical protein